MHFKINLTKAKCEYIKKWGAPRFEPTDIVPLVNKSFPQSFGNKKRVVKAVADRGWNPLNYNLLTVLPDAKDVVDLTSKDTTGSVVAVPALNLTRGVGTYYLYMLIEEGKKDEGRQKKFEAIKKEQKTNKQKIENLKKITKVSSAQLAACNHYVLDENVRDLVFARSTAIEAAQAATEQHKKIRRT